MTLPHRPFALRVAGLSHDLEVTRLRGRERLCGLYRFSLDLVTSRRLVAGGRALLGRAATLTIATADGAARLVHGVITRQGVAAHDASHEMRTLRLHLEPRMALLRHRVRSRVFHDLTPAAVVRAVLDGWRVDVVGRIARQAPRLEHCVQHRESDLAFVTRVLARHGISWWFEHPHGAGDADADDTRAELEGATIAGGGDLGDTDLGRERVVLCDHAERYSVLGGGATARALRYISLRADGGGYAPGDVPVFTADDRVRPTAARVTHYDPARHQPDGGRYVTDQSDLRDARTTEAALGLALDRFDSEHAPPVEAGSARALLEAARRDAARCRGKCFLPEVMPGHRFTLTDHACVELDGAYVVTGATHAGEVGPPGSGEPLYENRFTCAPAGTLVRPRYVATAPRQGVESATVVGDVADDVHVDAAGRVRVRFHWDARNGASPDERSCRVRVASSWAGVAWGAQFTPRAGSEVLVAFLDGDVDQPVVVGALHNGRDAAPFPAAEDSRRSGIRSQSVGGEGHNELSFEDLHGREEVYLRAQRNLREEVRRDRHANVHGNDALSVGGDVSAHVGGVARVVVDGHGRDSDLAVDVTARGELSVKSTNMLSITSDTSIVLTCDRAAIQMTPHEITLRVGDNLIAISERAITLDAPTIWQNGGQLIDLHADRINLNSREET